MANSMLAILAAGELFLPRVAGLRLVVVIAAQDSGKSPRGEATR